jgi:hypothetical protein
MRRKISRDETVDRYKSYIVQKWDENKNLIETFDSFISAAKTLNTLSLAAASCTAVGLTTIGSGIVLSKKFRHGKKIFLSAPVHHHFEAIGWPAYKIVMRYWEVHKQKCH